MLLSSLACASNYGLEFFPENSPDKIYGESYIKELDDLDAKEDKYTLFQKILDVNTDFDLALATNWIKDKALLRGDARYIYTYSYSLYKLASLSKDQGKRIDIMDTSLAMMLLAKFMMFIDSTRCEDKTAPGPKFAEWEAGAGKIIEHFKQLSVEKKLMIRSLVFNLEEKNKNRQASEWLCSGGLSFFIEYYEKHGDNSKSKIIDNPNGGAGTTRLLEDKEIKPKFITDEQWLRKREEIRDQYKKKYLNANP